MGCSATGGSPTASPSQSYGFPLLRDGSNRHVSVSALSDVVQAQRPFHMAHDHLSHLHSLFQSQARALDIAYANVLHHLNPLIKEFQIFALRAGKDLQTEESLLRGAKLDMVMLPKVVVHEAFTKKKEGTSGEGKTKTLADYVHPGRMEQVREACRITHGISSRA